MERVWDFGQVLAGPFYEHEGLYATKSTQRVRFSEKL